MYLDDGNFGSCIDSKACMIFLIFLTSHRTDERAGAAAAALMRYEFKFVYSSLSSYISVSYYTPAKFSAKKQRWRRGGGGVGGGTLQAAAAVELP